MLRFGAVVKVCPHCGKDTPQYPDGECKCLHCGNKIGTPRIVGGGWVETERGLVTAEKYDIRPNEGVLLPGIALPPGASVRMEEEEHG